MYEYHKTLPIAGEFDVIVVGSGSAGSSAAISSGRTGASTLLIERMGFLGGTSTAVLDTFYGYYTPGTQSIKVVAGIPDDVVKGLGKYSMYLERPNTFGAGMGVTYQPEYLKVVWETLVREADCNVLLNAWVQDVIKEGDTITGVVVATKLGMSVYKCKQIVDTSGDADICYQAGIDYELAGAIDPAQTLTTTFKMVNVDVPKRKSITKKEMHQLMAEAAESGQYELPRKEGSDHITPVDHMTATIMTRLKSYGERDGEVINATDPQLWSDAEIEGRRQALEYIRFLKDCVPGYEKSELSTFSSQIGVRETRRIYGEYRLNADDVLSAKKFDDQIGFCAAPMEDHHDGADTKWEYLPDGQSVGIPYRTLIPKDTQNILVAGRCFSANHVAHSSVRSMAQCMVMGEAAGMAAAKAAKEQKRPIDLDVQALREDLRKNNVMLD